MTSPTTAGSSSGPASVPTYDVARTSPEGYDLAALRKIDGYLRDFGAALADLTEEIAMERPDLQHWNLVASNSFVATGNFSWEDKMWLRRKSESHPELTTRMIDVAQEIAAVLQPMDDFKDLDWATLRANAWGGFVSCFRTLFADAVTAQVAAAEEDGPYVASRWMVDRAVQQLRSCMSAT